MLRILPGGVTSDSARLRIDLDEYGSPGGEGQAMFDAASLQFSPTPAAATLRTVRRSGVASVIVDVSGLAPGTEYRVQLASDPDVAAWFRTPPARVSTSASLLLGICSCYFPSDDFVANPQAIASCLARRAASGVAASVNPADEGLGRAGGLPVTALPHAFMLCGDQIYGDVPASFSRDLPREYERRYRAAWQRSRLGSVLELGGNFFVPDDHELWNDFPERSAWLSRSWDGRWRPTARTAIAAFWRHQGVWNFPPGFTGGEATGRSWSHGRLADIDVFIADSRLDRTSADGESRRPALMHPRGGTAAGPGMFQPDQLDALLTWLATIDRAGILVLPQPLMQRRGGRFDRALSDFRDQFATLMRRLWRTVDEDGKSVIVLTGDIHWSRLTQFRSRRSGAALVEFVASPLARVGLSSILATRFHGGRRSDVSRALDHADEAVVAAHTSPTRVERMFATGENNFGLVELSERDGGLTALFETWAIHTRRHAINEWATGSCAARLPL